MLTDFLVGSREEARLPDLRAMVALRMPLAPTLSSSSEMVVFALAMAMMPS